MTAAGFTHANAKMRGDRFQFADLSVPGISPHFFYRFVDFAHVLIVLHVVLLSSPNLKRQK